MFPRVYPLPSVYSQAHRPPAVPKEACGVTADPVPQAAEGGVRGVALWRKNMHYTAERHHRPTAPLPSRRRQ